MSARRFIVKGRDVHERATGAIALMPDRATAVIAARLMNEGADPNGWKWLTRPVSARSVALAHELGEREHNRG